MPSSSLNFPAIVKESNESMPISAKTTSSCNSERSISDSEETRAIAVVTRDDDFAGAFTGFGVAVANATAFGATLTGAVFVIGAAVGRLAADKAEAIGVA